MKKLFFHILAVSSALMLAGLGQTENSVTNEGLSEEDRQIIENLEFFENFEVLEEDSILIEEYDHIDKISLLGDDNE